MRKGRRLGGDKREMDDRICKPVFERSCGIWGQGEIESPTALEGIIQCATLIVLCRSLQCRGFQTFFKACHKNYHHSDSKDDILE